MNSDIVGDLDSEPTAKQKSRRPKKLKLLNYTNLDQLQDTLGTVDVAMKMLQKDNSSLGESAGILYALNDTLNKMISNPYSRLVRKYLLIRFPGFTKEEAICSFFVPQFKALQHCNQDLKRIVMDYVNSHFHSDKQPVFKKHKYDLFEVSMPKTEVEDYLSDTNITINANEFWEYNHKRFPILASIASKVLLPLASSAPSERIFSKAADIEMRKRYNMIEETLEAYVLVQSGFSSNRLIFK